MNEATFCPICRQWSAGLAAGPAGRPNAACMTCHSLERHRVAALLIPQLVSRTAGEGVVLDIAPYSVLSRFLKETFGSQLVGLDLDPAADGRSIDLQADITRLPLRSDSVDVVYCSHVLEHVPDDSAAIREIARVLHPSGFAYVQVPRRKGGVTEERVSASSQERLERFGQADHVRIYGDDFESRLQDEGLSVATTTIASILPQHLIQLVGAKPDEELWLAAGNRDPNQLLSSETLLEGLELGSPRMAERRLSDLIDERNRARAEARHWHDSYLQLRDRFPVRTLLYLKHLIDGKGRKPRDAG